MSTIQKTGEIVFIMLILDRCYAEACAELRRVFQTGKVSFEDRTQLEEELRVDRFEDEEEFQDGNIVDERRGKSAREGSVPSGPEINVEPPPLSR